MGGEVDSRGGSKVEGGACSDFRTLVGPLTSLRGGVESVDWAVYGSPRLRKELEGIWESFCLYVAGVIGVDNRENVVCVLFAWESKGSVVRFGGGGSWSRLRVWSGVSGES